MKRPFLVHFTALKTTSYISVKASLSMQERNSLNLLKEKTFSLSTPIESFHLMRGTKYRIKVIGLNDVREPCYKKTFDSDSFGNFSFKISNPIAQEISALQIFEIKHHQSLELLMGTYLPYQIPDPKKIIVSDFDKTLVDTRYSTTKEIYYSITKPIDYFPTITESIDLLKKYIDQAHNPFILTASPHFYENAIRDWLYKNEIYTAGIFLKDYRKVFSIIEGDLYPKDIKAQGFYKLNHLVDILLMTGIPEELVLMGDGFESDPLIYLLLKKILTQGIEPWDIWREVRNESAFRLTTKQNTFFLNKTYSLRNLVKNSEFPLKKFTIHIRKKELDQPIKIPIRSLEAELSQIHFYQA